MRCIKEAGWGSAGINKFIQIGRFNKFNIGDENDIFYDKYEKPYMIQYFQKITPCKLLKVLLDLEVYETND